MPENCRDCGWFNGGGPDDQTYDCEHDPPMDMEAAECPEYVAKGPACSKCAANVVCDVLPETDSLIVSLARAMQGDNMVEDCVSVRWVLEQFIAARCPVYREQ